MKDILLRSNHNDSNIKIKFAKNLNALSESMLEALKLNLEEIGKSNKIKSVIKASGRAFCPGRYQGNAGKKRS